MFNFTPIHPFDDAVWNAGSVKAAADIAVGAGWVFQPNGIASESDQQRSLPEGLDQSKDVLKSAAIWLRVVNARADYEPLAKFSTWLFRIAHHRLIDHYRRHARDKALLWESAGEENSIDYFPAPAELTPPAQVERERHALSPI